MKHRPKKKVASVKVVPENNAGPTMNDIDNETKTKKVDQIDDVRRSIFRRNHIICMCLN